MFAAVRQGGAGDAVVSIDGVMTDEVEHEHFRVLEPTTIRVEAAGSFEEAGSEASDTTLAAVAWIVRADDGALVWRMRPARPARGTFVAVTDSVRLPAGEYDAYVASYGDPLSRAPAARGGSLGDRLRTALNRSGRAWRGDAGRWRLAIQGGPAVERSGGAHDDVDADSAAVWRAFRVGSRDRRETLLQVTEPTRVQIRALVEVADNVLADSAYVVRLGTRDTVWTVRPDRAGWAGGSVKNRLASDEVALEPGFYRAVYTTDRDHAFNSWTANPPWAPWRWGMEVGRADGLSLLDPDAVDLPEVVAIRCAGPDEEVERAFTLSESTDVLAVAVGEVVDGTRYDFGGLDRELSPGDWDEVWEMPRRGLSPAGGSKKNRRAIAALTLEPGTYRIRYETDGSHDCGGSFNAERPDGDLWGIALYAFDPDFDPDSVERAAPEEGAEEVLAEVEPDGEASFSLPAPAEIRVTATGVLMEDAVYDAALITDAVGDTVWTMTWDATEPVRPSGLGASEFVRRFDGPVRLGAGDYTLRYQKDPSGIGDALGDVFPTEASDERGARVTR